MLLADYSGRLAAEIDDRRQLTRTLTVFLQSQRDGLAQNEQKLEVRKSFFFQLPLVYLCMPCLPHLSCHYYWFSICLCSGVLTLLVFQAFKVIFVFMYFSMLHTQWSACFVAKSDCNFQTADFSLSVRTASVAEERFLIRFAIEIQVRNACSFILGHWTQYSLNSMCTYFPYGKYQPKYLILFSHGHHFCGDNNCPAFIHRTPRG